MEGIVVSDGRLRANTLALARASYPRMDVGASCDGGRDNADIDLTYTHSKIYIWRK